MLNALLKIQKASSPAFKHLCNQCCARRSTSPLSQGNAHPAVVDAFWKAIYENLFSRSLWLFLPVWNLFLFFLQHTYLPQKIKDIFAVEKILNPASDNGLRGRVTRQHCRHLNWMVKKNTKQVGWQDQNNYSDTETGCPLTWVQQVASTGLQNQWGRSRRRKVPRTFKSSLMISFTWRWNYLWWNVWW